jgi:hypothetical protein
MEQTRMQKTISDITDVFAGGDGALNYMRFRWMMESLEEQSNKGDEYAKGCCEIVYGFKRLLDYANERKFTTPT